MESECPEPRSLITRKCVIETLQADKGRQAMLTSFRVVDFTKAGDNYSAFVSSVEVEYRSEDEVCHCVYIVKVNPGIDEFKEITNYMFLKEGKFYLELLPELNSAMEAAGQEILRFPKGFYGEFEDYKQLIFFEDLRPRDFRMIDKTIGMDEAHSSLMLKELARLHASSMLLEAKTKMPVERQYSFLQKDWMTMEEDGKLTTIPLIETNISTSVQMLKKIAGYEKAAAWTESLKLQVEDLITTGMKGDGFDVVCHGDCWTNNALFRYDNEGRPTEVMLVDAQVARKASLATDLNYFMYTSLSGDLRKSKLNYLLSTYYETFKSVLHAGGLEVPFTNQELLEEFRKKNKLGAIFAVFILPAVLMDAGGSEDGDDGITPDDMLTEAYQAKVMSMVDTNPTFKPRFLSIFDEFMEVGLIS